MVMNLKKRNFIFIFFLLFVLLWALVIFSFSFHNGLSSHRQSNWVLACVKSFLYNDHIHVNKKLLAWLYTPFLESNTGLTDDFIIRKTAHFTEYFVFGFFCTAAAAALKRNRLRLWPCLLFAGPVVAFIDEKFIQLYLTVGRTSSYRDVLLDSIGFYAAVIFFSVIILLVRMIRLAVKHR